MKRELKVAEAIKRLEYLQSHGMSYEPAVNVFKRGEDIAIFERQNNLFDAVFYCLKLNAGDNGMYDKLLKTYEHLEADGNVVYLIQISHTEFGTCASLFYVGNEEDEWEMDWDDLKNNIQLVYVENLDDPLGSEFGNIGFRYSKTCGGIVRIA